MWCVVGAHCQPAGLVSILVGKLRILEQQFVLPGCLRVASTATPCIHPAYVTLSDIMDQHSVGLVRARKRVTCMHEYALHSTHVLYRIQLRLLLN